MTELACRVCESIRETDGAVIYREGQPIGKMFFVVKGQLMYFQSRESQHVLDMDMDRNASLKHVYRSSCEVMMNTRGSRIAGWEHEIKIKRGSWMCEPSLWTKWRTRGVLVVLNECTYLGLEAAAFGEAVKEVVEAYARACLYARAFMLTLTELNTYTDFIEPPADYVTKALRVEEPL